MGGPTDRRSRISGRSVQGRPYEGRPEFIPSSRVVTPAGQAVLAHVALRGPPVDGRRGGAHRGAGLPEPGAPWLLPPPPELPEDPPPVVVPPVDELPPVLPPPVVPPVVPPPEVPYEGLGSALGFGWGFGLGFGLALGLGAVHGSPGPISHRETRVHVKTSVPDSGCCRHTCQAARSRASLSSCLPVWAWKGAARARPSSPRALDASSNRSPTRSGMPIRRVPSSCFGHSSRSGTAYRVSVLTDGRTVSPRAGIWKQTRQSASVPVTGRKAEEASAADTRSHEWSPLGPPWATGCSGGE